MPAPGDAPRRVKAFGAGKAPSPDAMRNGTVVIGIELAPCPVEKEIKICVRWF
jgi:hypothetical protein